MASVNLTKPGSFTSSCGGVQGASSRASLTLVNAVFSFGDNGHASFLLANPRRRRLFINGRKLLLVGLPDSFRFFLTLQVLIEDLVDTFDLVGKIDKVTSHILHAFVIIPRVDSFSHFTFYL